MGSRLLEFVWLILKQKILQFESKDYMNEYMRNKAAILTNIMVCIPMQYRAIIRTGATILRFHKQVSLEFCGFDFRGFEYLRFMINL